MKKQLRSYQILATIVFLALGVAGIYHKAYISPLLSVLAIAISFIIAILPTDLN